jgi:hypothetical protein
MGNEKFGTRHCELTDALLHSQVQFLVLFVHAFSLVFMNETCTCPRIVGLIWGLQNAVMFFMFAEFYRKTYRKKVSQISSKRSST